MSEKTLPKLTPVQQRMLDLLSDGLPHKKAELHSCLWDEESNVNAIHCHVSFLRKFVRLRGEEVVCELRTGYSVCYRLVRLIGKAALPEASTTPVLTTSYPT